jgi:hypothetical protein
MPFPVKISYEESKKEFEKSTEENPKSKTKNSSDVNK